MQPLTLIMIIVKNDRRGISVPWYLRQAERIHGYLAFRFVVLELRTLIGWDGHGDCNRNMQLLLLLP